MAEARAVREAVREAEAAVRRRFRGAGQSRLVLAGLAIALAFAVQALIPDRLAPHDPLTVQVERGLRPPGPGGWFGTDRFGRDVLSRVIHGARISLWVAFTSIGAATLIGGALGMVAGYFGGAADQVMSRIADVFFSFPGLLLAIAVAAMLGPGVSNAILAIAVVYSPHFFRIARAPALAEREREYVQAARAAGAGEAWLLVRHVVPNALSPVIVQASVGLSYAILIEASLSYLGLGTQPPAPSWGTMLNEGRTFLETAPWVSIFPGLAIMLAVLAFNLLGDGLRDLLDPRAA